jgi:hypothetical protein
MRSSTIISSSASVITSVINVLANAVVDSRSFLMLTSMCEPMGYRLEQRQEGLSGVKNLGNRQSGHKHPRLHLPTQVMAFGIATQAVCPAPRLSRTRASWRG